MAGLLPGEFRCDVPECREARSCPARGIVSWDKRTGTFPAGPEEQTGWPRDLPENARARTRRTEPREYAMWKVTLSCGHTADDAVTYDSSWTPTGGVTRTPPEDDSERQRRDWLIQFYGQQGDEWAKRYVTEDFPRADSVDDVPHLHAGEEDHRLPVHRRSHATAGPTSPPDPAKARAMLERELRKAELRVAKLRAELNSL